MPKHSHPIKQLASQTAIYGLPTIIGRILNYLLVPMYTRVFATSEYGVVTEFYAYVALIFVILLYGMETAFFRFSESENDKNKVFGTAVGSVIISSLAFLIFTLSLSGKIAGFIGYADNVEYVILFALILAIDAVSAIPFAHLRRQKKALKFSTIKIINISVNIAFNLFFILLCPYLTRQPLPEWIQLLLDLVYNPEIGVGYIFISNLIASLVTFILLIPTIIPAKLIPDVILLRKMLAYGWPLIILGIAGIFNETFSRIILKHLLPPEVDPMSQLGIFGASYKLAVIMTLFVQTFRYAAEPFFFEQMKSEKAPAIYAQTMNYFVMLGSTIFLAVCLFLDYAILFVGPEFRQGASVVPVLLMANLFFGIFYNLSVWFKIKDKTKYGAAISFIGVAITIILNLLFVPLLGYTGAAWATLICYFSVMIVSYLTGQKHYPVPYPVIRLISIVVVAVGLFLVESYIFSQVTDYENLRKMVLIKGFIALIAVSDRTIRRKLQSILTTSKG